ncbi:MAG: Fpg/Nei family DNA glycosylase [Thermoanaerobaculia bacterium]
MPELPEIELYARYFAAHALRQEIARVDVRDARILGVREEALARALNGRAFRSVSRHGKHLFADAGEQWLHLHFGMSGDLAYYRAMEDEPRFARVVFEFANGAHLAFEDMRLFGVVDLTPSPDDYVGEHKLGPDPLNPRFTLRRFREIVAPRRGAVKALLMSQEIIAGIGNLYADETLYQTGVHPRRPVDRLRDAEVKAIHTTMRRILRDVIERKERGKSYPPRYLVQHREEGERCPRCGGTIRRTVVFGRTTYFCARHQH